MTVQTRQHQKPLVLAIARDLLVDLRKRQAEHQEYVDKLWREQRLAPEFCFHGTYMWSGRDPICMMCEDRITIHEQALDGARFKVEVWQRRWQTYQMADALGMPMPDREATIAWVLEPVATTHEPITNRLGPAA